MTFKQKSIANTKKSLISDEKRMDLAVEKAGLFCWFPSSLWYHSFHGQDRRWGQRQPQRVSLAGRPVRERCVSVWRHPGQQPVGSDWCSVRWVSCHMTHHITPRVYATTPTFLSATFLKPCLTLAGPPPLCEFTSVAWP